MTSAHPTQIFSTRLSRFHSFLLKTGLLFLLTLVSLPNLWGGEGIFQGKFVPISAVPQTEGNGVFENYRNNPPQEGFELSAFLVVTGEIPDGSHIYSLSQLKVAGGMPTQITVHCDNADAEGIVIGPFETGGKILLEDFMGGKLEELTGSVSFAAPIYQKKDVLQNETSPLALTGEIDALCCDESSCRPVFEEFAFIEGSGENLPAVLTQIQENQKILHPDEVKESLANVNKSVGETPNLAGAEIQGEGFRWINLLYAFFGGMILNIMPCVLPVIGLKIISFFEQAGRSRVRAFRLNIFYSLGILTVFSVLALMSVGLSYLFTYGLFQIVMGSIVFMMALNLMGIWELTLPAFLGGKKSNELMKKEGEIGAWFKGVITTLLAIPCGAPLLSPALVWTDAMIKEGETGLVFGVYLVIGLGMASPYFLLGAFPESLKILPKPGVWMETFRNSMGFVLLIAVLWILFSMPLPLILSMVALLFALWFACWASGCVQFDSNRRKKGLVNAAGFLVVIATVFFSFNIPISRSPSETSFLHPYTLENAFTHKLTKWGIRAEKEGLLAQKEWALFDSQRFERDLEAGKTVIIDFTADWCMNCKILESAVLKTDAIQKIIDEKGIQTFTADWTNRGESAESRAVGDLLRRFGGEQVPILMIFTPQAPDQPIILRGLFTRERLETVLNELP